MNYTFFTCKLSSDQSSKILSALNTYNVKYLRTKNSLFKVYIIKRNNKLIYKDFYESYVSKPMKNLDVYVLEQDNRNIIVWDQYKEVVQNGQFDLVPQNQRQSFIFGKDSVWANLDSTLKHMFQANHYIPTQTQTSFNLQQKYYQWGDIIFKFAHVMRKQKHEGMLLTAYYEPSIFVQYNAHEQTFKNMSSLFRPVLKMLFEVGKLPDNLLESHIQKFNKNMTDIIYFYLKERKECHDMRDQIVKLDVLESILSIYYLKQMMDGRVSEMKPYDT